MIIIYDTETSGFPMTTKPVDTYGNARLVQLAWLLLDESFNKKASFSALIKPDYEWDIHEGAFAAHGISKSECDRYGISAEGAVKTFSEALLNAQYKVAHNLEFDNKIINIASQIYSISLPVLPSNLCTMQLMTPICKLPHKSNRTFGSQFK